MRTKQFLYCTTLSIIITLAARQHGESFITSSDNRSLLLWKLKRVWDKNHILIITWKRKIFGETRQSAWDVLFLFLWDRVGEVLTDPECPLFIYGIISNEAIFMPDVCLWLMLSSSRVETSFAVIPSVRMGGRWMLIQITPISKGNSGRRKSEVVRKHFQLSQDEDSFSAF